MSITIPNVYSAVALKAERGWSETLIKRYLGNADYCRWNKEVPTVPGFRRYRLSAAATFVICARLGAESQRKGTFVWYTGFGSRNTMSDKLSMKKRQEVFEHMGHTVRIERCRVYAGFDGALEDTKLDTTYVSIDGKLISLGPTSHRFPKKAARAFIDTMNAS